ncbi:hypothetical protein MSAN_01061200 [Mycena sanguinolenta]|uniref:Uncharacterized protein n=1 Tax=Mycena sanguinolenta TaxID=230812 RepID=A0A8H6YUC0_9AGAR|nr:hypothetical protein MSAN_01061200 [Mycena sanguinolenta]
MWSLDQVALHNKPTDCWVIIKNRVYDVTEFLEGKRAIFLKDPSHLPPEHPGGSKVILQYAGRDATSAYEPIHPSDALEKNLPLAKHLGPLSVSAVQSTANDHQNRKKTKDELRVEQALVERPPLARILSLADMEEVARKVLSIKAEAYYSSAADDHITTTENARAFSRFFFHPRVLRPVAKCNASTTMLGFKASIPVFASSAAMAKLGHPLGEINISKGAATTGIIQIVSSNASMSYAEIIQAVPPSQPLFFQLYKYRDDTAAEKRVREAERLGYKAIFLTVDTLVLGNREKDLRSRWVMEDLERGYPEVHMEGSEEAALPAFAASGAGMMSAHADMDMSWEKTIPWLRSITKLPLVIKGIQCVEDAVLAAEAGVDGILLSNHGGRQLEYSLPPIEVLYRLRKQRPDIFDKLEVYVEGTLWFIPHNFRANIYSTGGVKRGTDVLKALCLGATAVGLGRPFLYAQSAYGEAGVVKIVRILEREIISGMRGLGAASVKDLKPEMASKELYRRRLVHYHYIKNTEKLNKLHHAALTDPASLLCRRLFDQASLPWDGETLALKVALIDATESWEASTSCPVAFGLEDVRETMRLDAEQRDADASLEVCKVKIGFGAEGWVPTEHYETAMAYCKKMKEEMLARLTTAEDHALIEAHWVLDDFDEEKYK